MDALAWLRSNGDEEIAAMIDETNMNGHSAGRGHGETGWDILA